MPPLPLAATLFSLGLGGAFVAGLLGIGAGVLMVPLLLYVPPLLNVGQLDIKEVAALSLVQVLFASLSASLAHGRKGFVHRPLALYIGIPVALGALGGAVLSKFTASLVLYVIFGLLATAATFLLLLPSPQTREEMPPGQVRFPKPLAMLIGLGEGTLAGMVGVGGGFLLLPLLIQVLKIPTRVAIASSLVIVLIAGIAGSLGKLVTGQIPYALALFLVIGALLGAPVGAEISARTRARILRYLLAGLVAIIAFRIWWDIFLGS